MSAKGFVTEKELEEEKKRRQEEWDRVRQPGQPEVAPEPEETRPLYERLKEERDRKQLEFEETHKLKNLLRGLDSEETGFLEYVDDMRRKEEQKRRAEEQEVLAEVKKLAADAEPVDPAKISELTRKPLQTFSAKSKERNKQAQLLAGAVKKRKINDEDGARSVEKKVKSEETSDQQVGQSPEDVRVSYPSASVVTGVRISATKSIGVLPGLETYVDDTSDDSSNSSDSDDTNACMVYMAPVQRKLEQAEAQKMMEKLIGKEAKSSE